jgi:putative peptidoglycan lipid II flippase
MLIPSIGIYGPTFGILAAALLQVSVQIPGMLKQSPRYFFTWSLRDAGLHQIMRLLGPNIASVAIASVSITVDTAFVSYLADKASLAALHNAYTIFALPVALLAQSTAQSVLPRLSSLAAHGSYTRLRRLAIKVLASGVCLGIPTVLLLCFLGKPLIHVVFQHGAFGRHATNLTGLALTGYAVGLPAVIAIALMMSTFYSLKDALTPLLTNIFNFAVHLGLILLLLSHFKGPDAILAIPLAASGSATFEAILLGLLLFRRLRTNKEKVVR